MMMMLFLMVVLVAFMNFLDMLMMYRLFVVLLYMLMMLLLLIVKLRFLMLLMMDLWGLAVGGMLLLRLMLLEGLLDQLLRLVFINMIFLIDMDKKFTIGSTVLQR
jgi:hypothetical protein